MLAVADSQMMHFKVHGITRQPEGIRSWELVQTLHVSNAISVQLGTNIGVVLSDVAALNYEHCLGESVTKD